MYRFSDNYSEIVASISIDRHDSIFLNHLNFLIELNEEITYIYDIENL